MQTRCRFEMQTKCRFDLQMISESRCEKVLYRESQRKIQWGLAEFASGTVERDSEGPRREISEKKRGELRGTRRKITPEKRIEPKSGSTYKDSEKKLLDTLGKIRYNGWGLGKMGDIYVNDAHSPPLYSGILSSRFGLSL